MFLVASVIPFGRPRDRGALRALSHTLNRDPTEEVETAQELPRDPTAEAPEPELPRDPTAEAPPAHVGRGETPLGRLGHPEEIAATVYHLCQPDSAFITGQTIHVNGGRFLT